MRSNTRIKVTYPSILFFFFLYYIRNTVTAREKSTRCTSKIIYAPNGVSLSGGSKLKVNEKTFAAVALLPRYFLAVAAFLKKTFLKILILFLFLSQEAFPGVVPSE